MQWESLMACTASGSLQRHLVHGNCARNLNCNLTGSVNAGFCRAYSGNTVVDRPARDRHDHADHAHVHVQFSRTNVCCHFLFQPSYIPTGGLDDPIKLAVSIMGPTSNASRMLYFTIKDRRASQSLTNHLLRSPNDSLILPFCDYPGPIIEDVLSREFKSLTVCEPNNDTRDGFKNYLTQTYPNRRIRVHSDNLFDLSYKTYSDEAQQRCAEIVNSTLESSQAEENPKAPHDTSVKILVPLLRSKYETAFLRNIYYQVCLRLGLCSNHIVHYYFLMSDRQHAYLVAKPKQNMRLYRSSSVLYDTIFNLRTLESYDLKKCFGISVRSIQNTVANNVKSYKKVHLLWFEPKLDVINNQSPRSFIEYRFLVTQMMHKRTGKVVSFLEKFFDGYQNDLSNLGIDENTRVGDLSTEQFYKLFLFLKEQPTYSRSTFLHAAASSEDTIHSGFN